MKNRDDFCFLVFARHIAWLDLILLSTRIFPCCTNQVLRILSILDFDIHFYLLTTETRRAQREFSCPIGRRRSGKRSQPCGHHLITRSLRVNSWSQSKKFSPEALFPGRRLPAREKPPSSGLCGEFSIRPPLAVIMHSRVTSRI